MKIINTYKITLLLWIMSLCYLIQAQEFLTGISSNTQILKESQKQKRVFPDAHSILLPFFEDFSNYTGYPNEMLFVDRQAFVNNTFPLRPPSIGVVTLDALDEYGKIYSHLNEVSKGADTLTSRYIRLDSLFTTDTIRAIKLADSLYFSFYFQPGGAGIANSGHIGNQPNLNDSLVLEFGYFSDKINATVWEHIWSTPGFSVNEWNPESPPFQYFKQVLIPITDINYLSNRFQFRFRNYASLEPQLGISGWEGNVDQWHIDYIRLDVSRNSNDKFTNDLAFVSPTTSFLKNYQSMPWKQFQPSDMKSNFSNQLTNLSNGGRTPKYKYIITQNENVVYEYIPPGGGAVDINPYYTHGLYENEPITKPKISFVPNNLTDNTTFKTTHIFWNDSGTEADFCLSNDTCVFEQKFQNYYAYDDGTAEYGYCLNNQFNVAYLAMKFPIRVPDSLSAVRFWFNHTKNSQNEEAQFSILVWENNNGKPGKVIYTKEENSPTFASEFLDFVEYRFDEKVYVRDTIWIGFEQYGNVQLNIGFDQNNNSRDFFKYNTRGIWETSAFIGTPMLRPVFGKLNPLSIDCCLPPKNTTILAPNPVKDRVTITNYELRITNVEVYDIMGKKQKTESRKQETENSVTMDLSHLSTGVYFVRIYKENNTFETLKLIKN